MVLEGSRSDLVVVKMPEHASSGYVWQFGELVDAGLAIREDGRAPARAANTSAGSCSGR